MLGLSVIYLDLCFIARFLLASYICDLPRKTERSTISGVWQLVDNLRRCVSKNQLGHNFYFKGELSLQVIMVVARFWSSHCGQFFKNGLDKYH